jgi:RNA polymerase sigma-70 factor (ECF subfamily)
MGRNRASIDLEPLPWRTWIVAAQAGNRESYERLLRGLVPGLQKFVESAAPGRATDRLVEAILLEVHRSRHTYRPERPFDEWIASVAARLLGRSGKLRR